MSEMSWCNVLRRVGSDYCVNDISQGTFADFSLKIFTQERKIFTKDIYSISSHGDPCP